MTSLRPRLLVRHKILPTPTPASDSRTPRGDLTAADQNEGPDEEAHPLALLPSYPRATILSALQRRNIETGTKGLVAVVIRLNYVV